MTKTWTIIKNTLRYSLLALFVLLGLVVFIAYLYLRSTLPEYQGTIVVKGIQGPVEIVRNKWGVPEITAPSESDLFFAIGFVHAQDRLFQMDLNRRFATGRLAEIFGQLALDQDKQQQEQWLDEVLQQTAAQLTPAEHEVMQRYCDGVNAFIATQTLPPEFSLLRTHPEKWQIYDSLCVLINMENILLDSGSELYHYHAAQLLGEAKLRRIIGGTIGGTAILSSSDAKNWKASPSLDKELEKLNAQVGSNNWVIAGSHTVSGAPLLANDPHLRKSVPGFFYQLHAHAGAFAISGNTLPGIPLVIIGRNAHIGWGFTNTGSDVIDYYRLRINPDNPNQYWLDNKWQDFKTRTATIRVARAADQTYPLRSSVFGPVFEYHGEWLAENSLIRYPSTALRAILGMNRARTTAEFVAALRLFTAPAQNVVFADDAGNIGYYPAGWLPRRGEGDGSWPLMGDDSRRLWQGFVPESEKPFLLNPKKGYIVTANNPVIADTALAIFSRFWEPSFRADRIEEMITAKAKLNVHDMKNIQLDTLMKNAEFLLAKIRRIEVTSSKAQYVLDILRNWNCHADEGPAPYFFYVFEHELTEKLLRPHLKATEKPFNLPKSWLYRILHYPAIFPDQSAADVRFWLNSAGSPYKSFAQLVEAALCSAYDRFALAGQENIENIRWENIHTLTYEHPIGRILKPLFNRGPFFMRGSRQTVLSASFSGIDFHINHHSAFRMILDFSDFAESQMVLSSGQSGHILSRFYDDQMALFTSLKYRKMDETTAHSLRLTLKKKE